MMIIIIMIYAVVMAMIAMITVDESDDIMIIEGIK